MMRLCVGMPADAERIVWSDSSGRAACGADAVHGAHVYDGAELAESIADAEHGTPCLVCGAPIVENVGHDDGCMLAPIILSVELGHAALLAELRPVADWIAHRSYMQEDGTYRVTFTYRPS